MFEAVARELRAKLVALGNRSTTGFSRSANSSPHSVLQTRHAKPHRTHSAARTTKPPPTRHALHPQFPRVAPDADTPRGRPGGRPLGVSHQHSASSPSKLLKTSLVGITRARVARAAFPCDDTYCRRPTLRQRQGQLRKPWDFDPTDNWTQNECAPPGDRERTPCHAHSACCVGHQPFHWPFSAKLYHFQPIQWPPVYIAPESVLR